MWFYLVFISLTCEKASEINLQASIFISILVLCQRFIESSGSWEGLLWKLIPAPRQSDRIEGYARDCSHHSARFPLPCTQPLPADAAGESPMKPGDNNRDPKAKMCSQGFCSAPAAEVTWAQRTPETLVNGSLHLWCQTCLFILKSFSKTRLKWNKVSSPLPSLCKRKKSFLGLQHRPGQ